MNILFVCHRLPYPPNRGGKIRPFNMISHLSREHSVVVATLAHTKKEYADGAGLKKHCDEVIAEVEPQWKRLLRVFWALFTTMPFSVAYFRSPRLHKRISALLRERNFDLIFVHCGSMAQYGVD